MCQKANDSFENMENVKASLSNVNALVYAKPSIEENINHEDLFCQLTGRILSNMASFKCLHSLHIHSNDLFRVICSIRRPQVYELCISHSSAAHCQNWICISPI